MHWQHPHAPTPRAITAITRADSGLTATWHAQFAEFDAVCQEVLDAVDRLDLNTPVPAPEAPWFPKGVVWSVRWVWMHLIEELARHAGHADIVRESIDGAQMFSLMLAKDGLPDTPFLKAWKREVSV